MKKRQKEGRYVVRSWYRYRRFMVRAMTKPESETETKYQLLM